MNQFPDESQMERSADGSEPIRGGSIGINRILGRFVDGASKHYRPEFDMLVISALTVVRNVLGTIKDPSPAELDQAFSKDIELLMSYYNTYINYTTQTNDRSHKSPILVYFPRYTALDRDLIKEPSKSHAGVLAHYAALMRSYQIKDGVIGELDRTRLYFHNAGGTRLPHQELVHTIRELSQNESVRFSSGSTIGLMTHIPLDLYLVHRVRNINLLESFTGDVKKPDQVHLKLDKQGRLPLFSAVHATFGDSLMIKPKVTGKVRKLLFEKAEEEKWLGRSEHDVLARISKYAEIPATDLRKYDFI